MAKVEGTYHGAYDYAEVSQTSTPDTWGDPARPSSVPVAHGTPANALEDVIVLPFNDPVTAIAILDRHAADLACVLLDPMPHRVGLVPATVDFVEALREWTGQHDVLLVFDEVISLRSAYGGAQEWYDVSPDLTAMGKIIGGGFPVGALAGRREVMNVMDPLAENVRFPHSGTFSANPVTMRSGLTAMELFDSRAVEHVNHLGARARVGIEEAIAEVGIEACVTGAGSMLRVHLKATPPHDYRSGYSSDRETRALALVLDHLFDEGFIMINTCSAAMSTPMGDSEVDALVDGLTGGLRRAKALL
jgi:glutamate-1-semialdehyde 2,1-aminomutase